MIRLTLVTRRRIVMPAGGPGVIFGHGPGSDAGY